MTMLRVLSSRLADLLTKRCRDTELRDEIQAHLDALTDGLMRGGLIEQAHAAARREFGGVEQMKERYRDQRA